MGSFMLHTEETAPIGSKHTLALIEKSWGFIPNMVKISAEAPAFLEAMMGLRQFCEKTSFTLEEKHILHMTISHENKSRYCIAKGIMISKMQGFPEEDQKALLTGTPLKDAKLQVSGCLQPKCCITEGN